MPKNLACFEPGVASSFFFAQNDPRSSTMFRYPVLDLLLLRILRTRPSGCLYGEKPSALCPPRGMAGAAECNRGTQQLSSAKSCFEICIATCSALERSANSCFEITFYLAVPPP